jgi:ribose transport system substrate-binding protein
VSTTVPLSVWFGTRRRLPIAVAAAGTSALLFLSACSSSGGGSNNTTSNSGPTTSPTSSVSGNSDAIPAAQALLKQFSTRPTQIAVTTPVGKPIPTGKRIDFINCGSSDCTDLQPAMQAAANVLGWHLKIIDAGLTPQTVLAAWNLAVQDHPDGILADAFPRVMFAKPLAEAKAEGIPVVDTDVDETATDGLTAVVPDPQGTFKAQGIAWAAAVLGNLGKKADVLFLGSTAYNSLVDAQMYFKQEYSSLCPGCGYAAINVPPTAVGTTLPSDVLAYMRAHPGINAIIAGQGNMVTGLPQVLKTGGESAQIYTTYPNATMLQYLTSDEVQGIVMYEQTDDMWREMDAMARIMAGVSVAPSEVPSPMWLVTKDNATDVAPNYALVIDFEAQYEKLWGK